MSRGQGAKMARSKLIWSLALRASLRIGGWSTTPAVAGDPKDGVGSASRPWENYFGVAILSNDRTVVVGDKGVVMTSTNRGATWTRIQLTKDSKYYDLYSLAFTPNGSPAGQSATAAPFQNRRSCATWTQQRLHPDRCVAQGCSNRRTEGLRRWRARCRDLYRRRPRSLELAEVRRSGFLRCRLYRSHSRMGRR